MNQSDVRNKFTDIYRNNVWGSSESASGPGSGVKRTEVLRKSFQELLFSYGVESLLDLPCGDFNWMRHVNLKGIRYVGGDIVSDIVSHNRANYGGNGREFHELDLVSSRLPKVDMIFCRDCMVHLPDAMISQALRNIKRSGSTWLLATTFPDVKETIPSGLGGWRPVNLCDRKFSLRKPEKLIEENRASAYGRKCMGLWYIGDL